MSLDWLKPPEHIVKVVERRAVRIELGRQPPASPPYPPEYWGQFIPAVKRELFLRKLIYWTCVGLLAALLIYVLVKALSYEAQWGWGMGEHV